MLNKLMKFWTSMKLVSSGSVAIVCNSLLANSPEMSNYISNQMPQSHLKLFLKTRKKKQKQVKWPLTSTPRVISVISSGIMAAASVLVAFLSVDWPSLITIPIFLVLCLSPLPAEGMQYYRKLTMKHNWVVYGGYKEGIMWLHTKCPVECKSVFCCKNILTLLLLTAEHAFPHCPEGLCRHCLSIHERKTDGVDNVSFSVVLVEMKPNHVGISISLYGQATSCRANVEQTGKGSWKLQ